MFGKIEKRINLKDGDYFTKYDVPYYCQFASRDKVNDFIYSDKKKELLLSDPKWKEFGAKDREEYAYWAMNSCGVVVLRSAIEGMTGQKLGNNMKLIKEGVELGAFADEVGWSHKRLIRLAGNYGLKGRAVKATEGRIATEILKNNLVIVSISPLLGEKDTKIDRFGHLALAVGFQVKEKEVSGIYLHNPSGRTMELQEKAFIPIERFKEGYTGRAIIFSK